MKGVLAVVLACLVLLGGGVLFRLIGKLVYKLLGFERICDKNESLGCAVEEVFFGIMCSMLAIIVIVILYEIGLSLLPLIGIEV